MNVPTELAAMLKEAAIASLPHRAFLRASGPDATRWLNGMVTNSVQALGRGEGSYSFLLNAQGRILGDCTVYREPDSAQPSFLLAMDGTQLGAVQSHLDRFIIMDDVELTPALTDEASMLIAGPKASALLGSAGLPAPGSLRMARAGSPDGPVLILTSFAATIPLYEVRAATGTVQSLKAGLLAAGAVEISAEALEALRVLEGRPRYGRDITERYLPQETSQPQALHFNKGCYLGQEIVERIRSRGQVHRVFTPLTLSGQLPAELPAPIESEGRPVGEITSAAVVPLPEGEQTLGLGYVRREALDTHQPLTYNGGTAAQRNASGKPPSQSHPIS